jgi:hypothetical protein
MIGDLFEEYAIRWPSARTIGATFWCWRQVSLSAPPLLWTAIRRGRWVATLGVVLVLGLVVMALVVASDIVLARWLANNSAALEVGSITSFLLATMLGGYMAARIGPGAVRGLVAFVVVMSALGLATAPHVMPLWEQAVFLAAGPSASLAGARFRA